MSPRRKTVVLWAVQDALLCGGHLGHVIVAFLGPGPDGTKPRAQFMAKPATLRKLGRQLLSIADGFEKSTRKPAKEKTNG